MSGSLIPNAKQQFLDANGNPLAGGFVYYYIPSTTTFKNTYQDAALTILNTNPIILDSAGECMAYGTDNYRQIVTDVNGNLIWDQPTIAAFTNSSANVIYSPGFSGSVSRTVQSKLQEWVSIKDFGAVCDGTTNDTAAVQAAITSLGSTAETLLIPGPTKINASLTFGANTQLFFQQGAFILGTSGTEVIAVSKEPLAGLGQIFSNCAPISTTGMTVFPEWFGAVKNGSTNDQGAFTLAIAFLRNTGGLIQLQAGNYAITSAVDIPYNKITIQGVGNNISYLKVIGTNIGGLTITGTTGTHIANITLRDFSIISTTPGSSNNGIALTYTAFAILARMQIQDFIVGINMKGATNTQFDTIGATYTGTNNNFIGFNINGGSSAADANSSSNLRFCYASGVTGLTGQIGFKMSGVYMSDVQFDSCETAITNYGFVLDYHLAPDFNVDVMLRNPIVDQYALQGIFIDRLPSNGICSISGGYTNPANTGSSTDNIYMNSCAGSVNISDHQFNSLGTNYPYTNGVNMLSSADFTIANCIFNGLNKGIRSTGSGYGKIIGNSFHGGNPHAFTTCVEIIGGSRIMVTGNSFDGASQGVAIDNTSTNCGIVSNVANVATVGTRYINNSSTPVGAADGSTGLNSGV
jgi:hypothetical protein